MKTKTGPVKEKKKAAPEKAKKSPSKGAKKPEAAKAAGKTKAPAKKGVVKPYAAPDANRVSKILEILKKNYPEAQTALRHKDPLELLVATILSAQCTDERVNMVTPVLFAKYKNAAHFADCNIDELKEIIHSTGFFNNKAKNIVGMAKKLMESFNGKVPDTMEELLTLPGVARKTANVVLGSAFGKNEGVVVDTHVLRLSYRLGLSPQDKNAEKTEIDLMKIIPKEDWTWFSHAIIFHGRRICKARKPDCKGCPLGQVCPSAFTFE